MTTCSKRPLALCLAVSLTALGACSGGAMLPITDAEPGTYEYAKACFVAYGLEGVTKGSGPVPASSMDPIKDKAVALGKKQGMDGPEALTDLLKAMDRAYRGYESLSAADKAEYAAASEAFRKVCL